MAIADLSSATHFEIWVLNNCENNERAKEYRNYNMVKKLVRVNYVIGFFRIVREKFHNLRTKLKE